MDGKDSPGHDTFGDAKTEAKGSSGTSVEAACCKRNGPVGRNRESEQYLSAISQREKTVSEPLPNKWV